MNENWNIPKEYQVSYFTNVTKITLKEVGVYGQYMTAGVYGGYRFDEGVSLGTFHQTSAVVATYQSAGVVWDPFTWSITPDYNVGFGIATPTGAPVSVSGGIFYNVADNTATIQTGFTPFSVDFIEGGIYAVFDRTIDIIRVTPHVPVGQVSSMRYPGQFGTVPVGYEANALDVIGDSRTLSDYYKNSGSDLSNAIEARTDASVYQFNDRGNYYAGSGHPGYDARSPDSGGSSGGGSGQPPLPRKRQPPSNSGGSLSGRGFMYKITQAQFNRVSP